MAGPFAYHLRYHSDILNAYIGMPLELRGAYDTFLELLYERMKPLPNDVKWLSGWLQCSPRKTQSLIEDLINRGKLYVTNSGELSNERFDIEAQNREDWSKKSSKAAAKKWRNYRETHARSNQNNNLADANFKNGNAIKSKIEKEKENISPLNPPLGENGQSTKRGTRVPEDWRPSPELWAWAKAQDFTDPELELITAEFVDYWIAVPGAKGTKLNWNSTFKNRIRFKLERKGNDHGRRQTRTFADELAKVDAVIDELERRENAQCANGNGADAGDIPGLWQGASTISDRHH